MFAPLFQFLKKFDQQILIFQPFSAFSDKNGSISRFRLQFGGVEINGSATLPGEPTKRRPHQCRPMLKAQTTSVATTAGLGRMDICAPADGNG